MPRCLGNLRPLHTLRPSLGVNRTPRLSMAAKLSTIPYTAGQDSTQSRPTRPKFIRNCVQDSRSPSDLLRVSITRRWSESLLTRQESAKIYSAATCAHAEQRENPELHPILSRPLSIPARVNFAPTRHIVSKILKDLPAVTLGSKKNAELSHLLPPLSILARNASHYALLLIFISFIINFAPYATISSSR
ncbi:hypothetical protein B0H16DRAFT_91171 [Mycena metata]|uniref:Uncharacterized protein n=1 Tax=Mycena metata TaxID=1033252 RepID=A0AAD7IBX3_9AGAR|nr:hypothetical protein B0H16DRAFT_91171 [Mycena metata]